MIRIHNMLLAAALASSIALPCAAESLSLADLADAQDAQMIDMDAQDGAWTYPIPYDLLMTSDYIVLANKESLLDETYVPQDLVKLTCRKISSDPIQMREVAAQALSDMFDAAKADGVMPLIIVQETNACADRMKAFEFSHAKNHVFQPLEAE